jgi:AraC-like DNA-binding protein
LLVIQMAMFFPIAARNGRMTRALKPYVKEEYTDEDVRLPENPRFVFYHNGSFSVPSDRFTLGTDDPDKVNVVVAYSESVSNNGIFIQTFIQFSEIFILAFIFWRVETLQTLHAPQADTETTEFTDLTAEGDTKDGAEAGAAVTLPTNISQLLKQYCEDTQLYLQHDITRDDLSKAVGTNRSYLSLYFAQQGETYNSYINKLRIQHFVNDYREAIATKRPFTAQQLANESGFSSYATFGRAFKQTMGQTVTEWMKDEA